MLRYKSEEQDLFFDISLDLLCVANTAGYFVRLNPAFEKILGYTIEELKAEPFLEFVHPGDRDATKKAMATLVSHDTVNDFSNRYRCKDGTYRWLEWRAVPSGNLIYASARDVTDRIESAEELKKRLQFEALLAELSGRFVNIAGEQVDSEINAAMEKVCEQLGFDLAALWQLTPEVPPAFIMTHLYRPLPGLPAPERMDAQSYFPWSLEQLASGKTISLSTDDYLPVEATRDQEVWRHYGIKSVLVFPLTAGERTFFGALGFHAIREKKVFPEMLVKRLQLVAEIFANALARKYSERGLRESEERFSLASAAAGVGMWILDLDTGRLWASAKAKELFGLPPDYTLSFGYFLELVHPEDRQGVLQAANEASHSNDDVRIEYRIVLANNSIRWLASRGRRQLTFSGEAERLMGVTLDITDRKLMEGKIRQAAAEWQTTFDAIPDIVMILDKEFRIVRINAAAKSFFGLATEEIIGSCCYALMHDKEKPVDFCPFVKTMKSKGHEEDEFYDEKRKVWFRISTDPIIDDSGAITKIIYTLKDITDRKRADVEAYNARKELLRADRLMRMGELTASLAHELNQPLTSILSNARAAIRFIKSDRINMEGLAEILEDIAADDKRAGDIIRSLRSMVKSDEGEQEIIVLNDLMNETIALFHSESIMRNIQIKTEFADSLPPVEASRVQLQQVVINLMMNAAESMIDEVEKRIIMVQTRAIDDNRVRVAIRDFGTGIDEHELSRIFEPFFTMKHSGLGMGLSLSRSIIEAQAGHIWAENNPDGGATFYFELPGFRE